MTKMIDEALETVFTFGVGTNAPDINGNETAYQNLKQSAIEEAKAAIQAMLEDIIGKDEATNPYSPDGHDENNLRAKQRQRAAKYNLTLQGKE